MRLFLAFTIAIPSLLTAQNGRALVEQIADAMGGVNQVLAVKPGPGGRSGMPLTRARLLGATGMDERRST